MITRSSFDYFVDGVKAVKASVVSRKGRGKERIRWSGVPWAATLVAFNLGIVINDSTVWNIVLELADGNKACFPYEEFLLVD